MRALLIAFLGCSAPRAPEPVAPPIAAPIPIDAPVAPVAEPPPKDPLEGIDPTCRGSELSFDTEESEQPCLLPNTGDDPALLPPKDLEITAAVPSVKSGGTTTVVVTMTNKSTAPMIVDVSMTCDDEPAFPISVLDAAKKRVDYLPHKNCDTHTFGCTRRVLRIGLAPGGSMRKSRSFAAKVTRVTADCGDAPAGPIKPGTYVLRVVNGFDRDAEGIYRSVTDTTLVVK